MLVDPWLLRARPEHPAIDDLTYGELLERARRVVLPAPGERAALALPSAHDLAVALHACLLRGVVAVPVDPRLGEDERAQVVGGAALVTALEEGPPADPRPHDLDAPAIVVHTSGTTGRPKPVALTYGNWLWNAIGSAAALGHPRDERWLCCLPLSHVGGLAILTRSLVAGTTVLLHERWDTEAVLLGLDDATMVSLVPTTLARLLDAGLREPPALRWVLLGGAAIAPALLDRAREARVPVAPTYGMTEACSQVATLGPPLFCTRVGIGAGGEVLVAGPTVAPGAVAPDGWLHTGDAGALRPDGTLEVHGRIDDTIITGGENVHPAEVEAVLAAHPAVAEVAVHARPSAEWGQEVVATVVAAPGLVPIEEDLRAFAAARLAPFKVPKAVAVRAAPLPRTPSGKLKRALL